jgi:hypothetical protein
LSSFGVHVRFNCDLIISLNGSKVLVWFKVEQLFDPGVRSPQQLGLAFLEGGSLIKLNEVNNNCVLRIIYFTSL